ncbi:uncharacterized protein LOC128388275 [Panonychus citri]|uniref:uncharacterized protein LOC128388275 n=1 Tax=Panonychus citri TaxID=50023 RepID=UPI00230765A0|nr:uncharacterized protein LOC128388275 [Panonychus citri]
MAEQQWTLLDTKVTIVNRTKSYEIFKQKLSSIPYFVKLFSDPNFDLIKIELDLDESSFDNIVDFIHKDHLSFSLENALSMMETADYLGMEEIKLKYYDFFLSNFNIEVLEDYLVFYEKRNLPRMFDEEKLNSFIGKYFLPISNTRAFLKFSVSLLERILKLKLVVSYEYQIVEAIDRWIKFNEKDRNQYVPRLIKFVNFCHLHKQQMKNVASILENAGFCIYTLQLNVHSFHACHPKSCQSDCESTRHYYYKSLVAIYELDEDTIEIRRMTESKHWTIYGQFTRDETISSSLIEAHHIFDIIYDSGRKGIRVDWNTNKFKYLKMFGEENSYYDQIQKYITHDIKPPNLIRGVITDSKMAHTYGHSLSPTRLESISLHDHFEGICYGNELPGASHYYAPSTYPVPEKSGIKQYYLPYLDYKQFSSCPFKGPTETLACFDKLYTNTHNYHVKYVYLLTKNGFSFSCGQQREGKKLDYSSLKSFIGSDSLDHIEMISHNNSVLVCNKETKTICSYNGDTDHWKIFLKIESPER